MMVFFLALFGMVCWGIAPIFAKIGLKNVDPLSGLLLRTVFASSLVCIWIIASGSFSKLVEIPVSAWILIAAEAMLATLVGDLAYYAAIKKGNVSMVTIIMSTSPIVTILCAVLFLGETITLTKIIGAALVIIGIILVV